MSQTPPPPRSRRPEAWEDDVSRLALDELPFHNAPPITQCDRDEIARTVAHVIDPALYGDGELDRFIDNDRAALPGPDDREGYVTDSDVGFWVSGLHDFLRVRQTLRQLDFIPHNLFELGCASGRVLRHFAAQWPHLPLWACDINYRHVRWIIEHLRPDIRCFHAPVLPHLPIGDEQVDVTCAFSVFTHLDVFETAWMAELHRIMRSGGYAYLTFQTESTWESVRSAPLSDRRRAMIERSSPETLALLEGPLPPGRTVIRRIQHGPYRGLVFHHTDYLRDRWGRFFEVVQIRHKFHGIDQTVFVLRKG